MLKFVPDCCKNQYYKELFRKQEEKGAFSNLISKIKLPSRESLLAKQFFEIRYAALA